MIETTTSTEPTTSKFFVITEVSFPGSSECEITPRWVVKDHVKGEEKVRELNRHTLDLPEDHPSFITEFEILQYHEENDLDMRDSMFYIIDPIEVLI